MAETTRELDYPGVVGLGAMPIWFVERAAELGHSFRRAIPQRIHVLRRRPVYPGVSGSPGEVTAADGPLFADWIAAFAQEAVPDDPVTPRAELEKAAGDGRHLFWVVDETPVSVAGIMRRFSHAGAIGAVYTPPALRGCGFAGSVTAAVAERPFAEGKTAVCLFTDLRNAASNCQSARNFDPLFHRLEARFDGRPTLLILDEAWTFLDDALFLPLFQGGRRAGFSDEDT